MTALDAVPDGTAQPVPQEAPAPAVVGPMAGDPAMLGLSSFIVGSVALGLGLVGVVPIGLLGAIWAAAVGPSAVAAVFGIFGTFWLSYVVLVLGLDHNWFAITVTAVLAVVLVFAALGVYL